jgi:endonuclease III
MGRLHEWGLTPERVAEVSIEDLGKLIYPVGFYRKKAEFLRLAAQRCLDEFGGDIPSMDCIFLFFLHFKFFRHS